MSFAKWQSSYLPTWKINKKEISKSLVAYSEISNPSNIYDVTFLESSFPGKSVYLLLAEFKSAECLLIQFAVADILEIIDL